MRLGDVLPAALHAWLDGQTRAQLAEHVALAASLGYLVVLGARNFTLSGLIDAIPGGKRLLNAQLEKEVEGAMQQYFGGKNKDVVTVLALPAKGMDPEYLMAELRKMKAGEADVTEGQKINTFAWVYTTNDHAHTKFVEEAHTLYAHENALSPMTFPALRKFENEVVQMTLRLFNAPPRGAGVMTSGGTESILCMVYAVRERARAEHPHIRTPNIVTCVTAHPALGKGCHMFGVELREAPYDATTGRCDMAAYAALIDGNTIGSYLSAPGYPHGVVDDIEAGSRLALKHKIPLHVDGCLGGYVLPWMERLGYPVPLWDFRLAGVTSISADLHKYGFSAKGSSTLTWRSGELRKYQFYTKAGWPGGLYAYL